MTALLIQSEAELVKAFRPRDQKHVFIPKAMRFPLSVNPYLAWTEPSGVRIYLVFTRSEQPGPIGVVFRRDQQGSMVSPTGVCDWCVAHGPSDQVRLLTATVSPKVRVGVNLCLDLSCGQKLEKIAVQTGQDLEEMHRKLTSKMARFCTEALRLKLES